MTRPTLGSSPTVRLNMLITQAEVDAINDWRFANRVPTLSEAVRILLQSSLDPEKKPIIRERIVEKHPDPATVLDQYTTRVVRKLSQRRAPAQSEAA